MADSSNSDDEGQTRLLVPNDRIFERTMGCWNCRNMVSAKPWWTDKREKDLTRALIIAQSSRLGERDPKCINIRHMVNTVDHGVASGALVRCSGKGRTPTGQDVGDVIANSYLCDRWSAAQGASIARAGQGPDALPEELADKLGDAVPDFSGVVVEPGTES